MSKNSIHVGAVAPYRIRYIVRSEEFDLSVLISAEFVVRDRTGDKGDFSWPASIISSETDAAVIEHTFVAGDLEDTCQLLVEPRLTTPSGVVRAEARSISVVNSFDL